jgi:hypothetical protein
MVNAMNVRAGLRVSVTVNGIVRKRRVRTMDDERDTLIDGVLSHFRLCYRMRRREYPSATMARRCQREKHSCEAVLKAVAHHVMSGDIDAATRWWLVLRVAYGSALPIHLEALCHAVTDCARVLGMEDV